MPRKDALLQLNINPNERARINALIMSFTIALLSLWLPGRLAVQYRPPFTICIYITIYTIAIIIVGKICDPEFAQE